MSRTYKHQRMFDVKNYWRTHGSRFGLDRAYDENGECIGWKRYPEGKKDIHEPDAFHNSMFIEVRRKKWIERDLQRKFRRKVRHMIRQEEYDLLPMKPEDSAWIVW